jgi:hypothetical protein
MDMVEVADGAIELHDDGQLVATARMWDADTDVPPPPTAAQLDIAVGAFDVDDYTARHAFPTCFSCGPMRAPGDGLRLFPAAVEGSALIAWPWRPAITTAADDGVVDPRVIWAALDCPSGLAYLHSTVGEGPGPGVLGQLAVRIIRRPAVDEPLVVGGWRRGRDGRKLYAGSAVWTSDGELVASGEATWILLDGGQIESFGAAAPAT